MEYIYYEDNPQLAIDKCAACLKTGGTAVVPAGTVYGLVGHCKSLDAYQQIFRIKGRESSKPIALLVSNTYVAFQGIIDLIEGQREIFTGFMSGKLTVVADANQINGFPEQVQLIQPGKVGIRFPAGSPACRILDAMGGLVWGTSANSSGHPHCSTAEEVKAWLQNPLKVPDLVVLSNLPQQGQPSQVLHISKQK